MHKLSQWFYHFNPKSLSLHLQLNMAFLLAGPGQGWVFLACENSRPSGRLFTQAKLSILVGLCEQTNRLICSPSQAWHFKMYLQQQDINYCF